MFANAVQLRGRGRRISSGWIVIAVAADDDNGRWTEIARTGELKRCFILSSTSQFHIVGLRKEKGDSRSLYAPLLWVLGATLLLIILLVRHRGVLLCPQRIFLVCSDVWWWRVATLSRPAELKAGREAKRRRRVGRLSRAVCQKELGFAVNA